MAINPLVSMQNINLRRYIHGLRASNASLSRQGPIQFKAHDQHQSPLHNQNHNIHQLSTHANYYQSGVATGQLGAVRMEIRRLTYSQVRTYFSLSTGQLNGQPALANVHQCDTKSGPIIRRYATTKHDKYFAKRMQQRRDSSTFKDSIFFKSDSGGQQSLALTTTDNNSKELVANPNDSRPNHDETNDDKNDDRSQNSAGGTNTKNNRSTTNRGGGGGGNFVHRNDQITLQQTGQSVVGGGVDGTATTTDQETAEDLIFDMFNNGNDGIRMKEFLSSLSAAGLHYDTDPRLKEFKRNLKALRRDQEGPMSKQDFKAAIKPNIVLISRAMRGDFVIPDWTKFTKTLEEFYWRCRINKNGNVANYIPQLAKYNPDYWGVSICSIDGQRYHVGDVDVPFTIQSSGKPINYAIALNELGSATTHKFVGQEPSGRLFNDLSLKIFDDSGHPKPHNPMVNSGAIVTCSLLMKLIKPEMRSSEKFDWVCDFYKSMAGGEYIGFNNATFLSEREAADRNYAIGFYMRENKCFPDDTNLQQVMDFYFQLCSLEVNCKTVSMIAATLANGGICPITEKKVIDSRAVRNVLSLMHSCGMYDYSGQFAFYVGLPAKSGVSGCTLVVIPNVGGLGLFSPPLDTYGNSVRSLQFCHELVDQFNFHQYDNLRHVPHKSDPRRKKYETLGLNIICLLFAAAKGDMSAIRRYYMSGMDMSLSDYDHRTALHAAAAEGNLDIIEFLLQVANVHHEPRDRWGRRPIDDASYCGHLNVVDFLKAWPQLRDKRDQ